MANGTRPYVAHAARDDGRPRFHALADHLRHTAHRAEAFAETFGAARWGLYAGLWHDLGKYRPPFQHKLYQFGDPDTHIEGRDPRVSHSHAGALHAIKKLGDAKGLPLSLLIAGHHTGLPDLHSNDGGASSLKARLDAAMAIEEYAEALREPIPADILEPGIDPPATIPGGADGYALWIRMLFSCLVDADFLDTETFFDPERAARRGRFPPLEAMRDEYRRHMDAMARRCASTAAAGPVNAQRALVLAQCLAKGRDIAIAPGFFRLTVPTGGGKTLASLGFVLEHALTHGRRRIVYAIPYTSIIEQTASVFRDVFAALGDEIVLEHHSNLDVDEKHENHANRIATDNWDAPLVVTTNVQLFESLHAARTSRCRKLHNLVGSVIVLDEAQMLPREFLAPVLRVLKLLVVHYGVSVVLCTATQPMLASRREPVTGRIALDGIDDARDLVDDTGPLFEALDRVEFHWPADLDVATPWETLAEQIRDHDCALVIVNKRDHARHLFALLDDPDAVHLSALMCAEHRSAVIAQIRERLAARRNGDSRPLRVVSTSLVEAGVDLDFPVVFRALAGLDAIAQAAGRCNREGVLPHKGQVYVFVASGGLTPGSLKRGAEVTAEMVKTNRVGARLMPHHFVDYFNRYYSVREIDFDKYGVTELLTPKKSAFRTAAEKFRLIDDNGETVVVPYRHAAETESRVHAWVGALAADGKATWARRKLQRYTVTVPKTALDELIRNGDVEERAGLWVALDSRYGALIGLMPASDHGPAGGLHA